MKVFNDSLKIMKFHKLKFSMIVNIYCSCEKHCSYEISLNLCNYQNHSEGILIVLKTMDLKSIVLYSLC